jgi:hypothetical protein
VILTVILEGITKAATILSILMKVYTIPCHKGGYINVMLVLQSCTDPLYIPPGSSTDTYGTSSDCAYHIGNVKVEEDLDMQEEEEVNVKIEKGIGSEEEECIGIEDEEGMYSEEEEEEEEIDTKEEDVDIKEEVSLEDTV